jgi:hypothetical protein
LHRGCRFGNSQIQLTQSAWPDLPSSSAQQIEDD